jgi:hypothetical protein
VKRSLPTLGDKRKAQASRTPRSLLPAPPERSVTSHPLVCVAPVRLEAATWSAATGFCVDLTRALIEIVQGVCVIVTIDRPDFAGHAQTSFAQLADLGAREVKLVAVSDDPTATLGQVLGSLPDPGVIVSLGQALPLYFQPLMCAVVAGPNPTASGRHPALAAQADLEVSDPGAVLPREIANMLATRLH